MTKVSRWLGLGSILLSHSALAQEAGKAEPKPQPLVNSNITNLSQAEIVVQVKAAQADLKQAQERLIQAQNQAHNRLDVDPFGTTRQYHPQIMRARPTNPTRTIVRFTPDSFVKSYGLDFVEADPVLRSQLGLPNGEGLVVIKITSSSPAEQAGIKEKDLIAKINLQAVSSVSKAKEIIAREGIKSVDFDLIRAGEPIHLSMAIPKEVAAATTYWIGVPVAVVDATLRSQLPNLPADAGLIVTDVVSDSPAARAGVQKYDILIKVGDKPVIANEALIELLQKTDGKEIRFDVLRAGKPIELTIRPEKRVFPAKLLVAEPIGPGVSHDQIFRNLPLNNLVIETVLPYTSSSKTITNNVPVEIHSRLEQEMSALTEQIESLRQAILELKKN